MALSFTNYGSRKTGPGSGTEPRRPRCAFTGPTSACRCASKARFVASPRAAPDAYFQSRPRGSQLSAWASQQSTAMPGRETLLLSTPPSASASVEGPVPRPDFWGGYRLSPSALSSGPASPIACMTACCTYAATGLETTRLFPWAAHAAARAARSLA